MLQQIMAHIAAIKKDMIILEKSEFSALKHEYEVKSFKLGFNISNISNMYISVIPQTSRLKSHAMFSFFRNKVLN